MILKATLGIEKVLLLKLGEERLLDFDALCSAGRFHSAIYMGGYAVEAFLKGCICTRLDCDKLPKVYELHDLDTLLFFAGLEKEIATHPGVEIAFMEISNVWLDGAIRYKDPAASGYDARKCASMNTWLHDPQTGVVPWLKARL